MMTGVVGNMYMHILGIHVFSVCVVWVSVGNWYVEYIYKGMYVQEECMLSVYMWKGLLGVCCGVHVSHVYELRGE